MKTERMQVICQICGKFFFAKIEKHLVRHAVCTCYECEKLRKSSELLGVYEFAEACKRKIGETL